jgi:hypothetical protein
LGGRKGSRAQHKRKGARRQMNSVVQWRTFLPFVEGQGHASGSHSVGHLLPCEQKRTMQGAGHKKLFFGGNVHLLPALFSSSFLCSHLLTFLLSFLSSFPPFRSCFVPRPSFHIRPTSSWTRHLIPIVSLHAHTPHGPLSLPPLPGTFISQEVPKMVVKASERKGAA